MPVKSLRILGTRGVPAAHGGFETFAERLALYLVDKGWAVTVYCQEQGRGALFEDQWQGIQRVRIPVENDGPLGTVIFDWKATRHAAGSRTPCLTLGYNTALFCALLRWGGAPNTINMDGIEWKRAKWGPVAKTWFWINERAGARLGDQLVADHPEIARHLGRMAPASKVAMVAYGADALRDVDAEPVVKLGLQPGRILTLVARPEPENSVLEAVSGFSRRKRGLTLAVLGGYREDNAYHRAVREAASDEVRFLGAIYEKPVVQALRFHSLLYLHGHQVGGTNPSLIEALGAGNAVIAHDNRFNRWVLGDAGRFFHDADSMDEVLTTTLADVEGLHRLQAASRARFESAFTWPKILQEYEALLTRLAAP
jgi:glycosyltransferase involved in cell wall biosynthesis